MRKAADPAPAGGRRLGWDRVAPDTRDWRPGPRLRGTTWPPPGLTIPCRPGLHAPPYRSFPRSDPPPGWWPVPLGAPTRLCCNPTKTWPKQFVFGHEFYVDHQRKREEYQRRYIGYKAGNQAELNGCEWF